MSHGLDSNHPQLRFQDKSNQVFRCNPPNQRPGSGLDSAGTTSNANSKTTRELTSFIDYQHSFFQQEGKTEFRQNVYNPGPVIHRGIQNWHVGNGRASNSPSDDGSDGNEDDDNVEGLVNSSDNKNNNSSNTSGHSSEKDGNVKMNHASSFGSSREALKVGNVVPSRNDLNDVRPSSSENHQQREVSPYQNAVALVERDGDLYYSQYIHGAEGSGAALKDIVENGCGFSGRKDASYSGESGDSLRAILSDPLTGALMDDAMILPCGHSFGTGGIQHVMKMKACYTCLQPVSEGSVASNLSLRASVLAFRREEEMQAHHSFKRRRERSEQDRIIQGDSFMDTSRGRGLQFPFAVADRVIIKGNKRTPERFVGREAVVTTQCLNGWYVVKTVDNAESIKLQYRSLAKVSDFSSMHPTSSKMTPNWL